MPRKPKVKPDRAAPKGTRAAPKSSRAKRMLPDGLRVGHAQDTTGLTGLTVLLFDRSATAVGSIRGSAPATCNFSTLDPLYASNRVDALLFTGGSTFGLSAVLGVQRFLEDRGQGFDVGVTTIPRVPAAAIFDLAIGDYTSRPTAQMSIDACLAASQSIPAVGSVGAGTGATVGKFLGLSHAMRGGFGVSEAHTSNGAQVWCFAVVNAFGDVWNSGRTELLCGARTGHDQHTMADASAMIGKGWRRLGYGAASMVVPPPGSPKFWDEPRQKSGQISDNDPGALDNTTLVALVTTAAVDISGLAKLADACHAGVTDVIHPAHTIYDGDLSIAASIGDQKEDIIELCILAQSLTARAIHSGIRAAKSAQEVPAWADLQSLS